MAEQEKAPLEALALALGQTWGDRPNVSKLIKAIAKGELQVAYNNDWSRDRVNLLYLALNHLKDHDYSDAAVEFAQLLLERNELSHPLRHEIQLWLESPGIPRQKEIQKFRHQARPFRLTYADAAERIWSFTVRHAVIQRHEERQYLDCWCDETEGNQDIESLQHNWSLRLDRILPEAIITPVKGLYRPGLDHVDVELHLVNRLAASYRTKHTWDLTNEWLPVQQVRRVVRRVQNTFWFLREIHRYGSDCLIVSPASVREKFVKDLELTLQKYQFKD